MAAGRTMQGLALATADLDEAIAYAQQAAALFQHGGDRSRHPNTLYTMADGASIGADTRHAPAEIASTMRAMGSLMGSQRDGPLSVSDMLGSAAVMLEAAPRDVVQAC